MVSIIIQMAVVKCCFELVLRACVVIYIHQTESIVYIDFLHNISAVESTIVFKWQFSQLSFCPTRDLYLQTSGLGSGLDL